MLLLSEWSGTLYWGYLLPHWLHVSCGGPTVLPACTFLAPVAPLYFPPWSKHETLGNITASLGYMEAELGRPFAQHLWWLGKVSCPTELEWVVPTGDLEWLVQWELCCQHWGAAVKFPAVTLRRVSSLHVIDDFEKWQIYWCPDSLQPPRRLIVYLIISWTAKTDAVAADNRERNGANDECSNTSPHWTKAASMHCGTAFFVLKDLIHTFCTLCHLPMFCWKASLRLSSF